MPIRTTLCGVAALLSCVLAACGGPEDPRVKREAQRLDLTPKEVEVLTQAAQERARSLQYDVSDKGFTLKKNPSGPGYVGVFEPRSKTALGGELHVYLDKTGRVLRHAMGP